MMIQGFKNGMSFRQVRDRMPALVARKMRISEAEFYILLEREAGPADQALNSLVDRITAQFSPAEKLKVLARK